MKKIIKKTKKKTEKELMLELMHKFSETWTQLYEYDNKKSLMEKKQKLGCNCLCHKITE